jgi:AcrR family transcriptional regulator
MNIQKPDKSHGWRGSANLWLDAGYERLISGGVEAVKILPLAKALGLSRTSFYWHFADRDALLAAIVDRWSAQNTGNLLARSAAPAQTICGAVFKLFDCWIDANLFDAKLDLAIRNWAQNDASLRVHVDAADGARISGISDMFQKFGYSETQARTRAHTMIFTQVGYYAMALDEDRSDRLRAMPPYVEVFTGHAPTTDEITAFFSRHGLVDGAAGLA